MFVSDQGDLEEESDDFERTRIGEIRTRNESFLDTMSIEWQIRIVSEE
jgi:hypothetical protein